MSHFSKSVRLVTSGWIREEYHGDQIYPFSVQFLSVRYLQSIQEQWHPQHSDCAALSDKGKTITRISSSSNTSQQHHPYNLIAFGSIIGSTEGGHHEWKMKINNYWKLISVGISYVTKHESLKKYYGIDFFKGDFTVKQYEFQISGAKNEITVYDHVDDRNNNNLDGLKNGDILVVKLRGKIVNFQVFREGQIQIETDINIQHGNYKIFVRLNQIGDSISIISYQQTDKVPKCTARDGTKWCEYEIQNDWQYCPNCSSIYY